MGPEGEQKVGVQVLVQGWESWAVVHSVAVQYSGWWLIGWHYTGW